jgi:NAD(P)-dependent dehydrogenase (short-subunit alcohol dehydrogenase family)
MALSGKTILITGAARRIGRQLALSAAQAGAEVIIHHGHSPAEAESVKDEIHNLGSKAYLIQADLQDPEEIQSLIQFAENFTNLYGLVNNAAIFGDLTWQDTSLADWEQHFQVNLTAPFQLSQAFASQILPDRRGRIINLLDWRALRPGPDHFPYTVTKAALAAMTQSLAAALAPQIQVNGIALGAILPPSDEGDTAGLIDRVPQERWGHLDEVGDMLLFLLTGPSYLTGELIHLDGGRHLV